MASETKVVKEVMVYASITGARLFRNNCGSLPDPTGRWVSFGVGNPGGSDTIGWRPVTITIDMVGRTIAQFLAVECKEYEGMGETELRDFVARKMGSGSRAAKHAQEQLNFIDNVRRMGGVAGIARNKEELASILKG